MTYPNLRRQAIRRDLDRKTWPEVTIIRADYETLGTGEFITGLIDFGTSFADVPFFSYGVELQPVEGDFPHITCGVTEWDTTTKDPDGFSSPLYYNGAYVWINIYATTAYTTKFSFRFEATAFKNVDYFRGLASG